MTRDEYRRSCQMVSVLVDLIATEIRSFASRGEDEGLYRDVEAISVRWAKLAKRNITTRAERARMKRRLDQMLNRRKAR